MTSLVRIEEQIYDEIKSRILNGQLSPGTRLIIRNLAKTLEVSPTPVVLALRMLERDGLVVNTPGLGSQVRKWTKQEIVELYEIRRGHEAMACRLCAERATGSDLERITDANDRFIRTSEECDDEGNLKADVDFHLAIVHGAHSPDLARIVENLAIMQCCMKAYCLSLEIPSIVGPTTKGVHEEILQAILNRDSKAAEQAGIYHVEETLKHHLSLIGKVEAHEIQQETEKLAAAFATSK